jgi:hypothetical protein
MLRDQPGSTNLKSFRKNRGSSCNAASELQQLNQLDPSQRDRDWWDDETFLALMRIRGMECRSRYAEAFQASKAVLSLGQGERGTQSFRRSLDYLRLLR